MMRWLTDHSDVSDGVAALWERPARQRRGKTRWRRSWSCCACWTPFR